MFVIASLKFDDDVVRSERLELDTATTLADIQNKLSEFFFIDEQHQTLFLKSTNLTLSYAPNTVLTSICQEGDTIVLVHKHENLWTCLKQISDAFKEEICEAVKKTLYETALPNIQRLLKIQFFVTFPDMTSEFNKIQKHLYSHYDKRRGAIERSSRAYFQNMYSGNDIEVTFVSKLYGTRRGVVCSVRKNDETLKYFIKTHHGGGSRDSNTREDIDIKELFAYKLLERLGVGAEIHLIPNEQRSKWIIYIGSREIVGFQTISDLELLNDNLTQYVTPVVQMLALFTTLNMCDHHSLNMGVNENNSPYIIDFYLVERDSIDVKRDFYDKVRTAEKINKQLGSFDNRLQIAKNFLDKINFYTVADETLRDFLKEYQSLFQSTGLIFLSKVKTDDLQRYVDKIKENANKFNEL